jgi:hypothetical protein
VRSAIAVKRLRTTRLGTLAVESGRGRGSGAEVQSARTAHVWTLRDGKAVRLDLFNDRGEALKAVRLAE